MSAVGLQDFDDFVDFVEKFSLKCIANDPDKARVIRIAHTQFLALLTITSELRATDGSANQDFRILYGATGENYLGEVVSDCSEFVMCVLVGLFRSAGSTLRSAIESYLKAFSSNHQPMILQRTSVPDVFSDAMTTPFFATDIGKRVAADLKAVYAELNGFVHTISAGYMFGAPAVGAFPCWSEENVRLVKLFVRVVRLFLYGVVGSRRDLYDRFDHRNKAIVNRAMRRDQRRSALGVDG